MGSLRVASTAKLVLAEAKAPYHQAEVLLPISTNDLMLSRHKSGFFQKQLDKEVVLREVNRNCSNMIMR